MLVVNAWELLFKSKILALNSNDMRSIWEVEGGKVKTGHSGNPVTISCHKAMRVLSSLTRLDQRIQSNVESMIEIRDSAVHYMNEHQEFQLLVLTLGNATVKNYCTAEATWFPGKLAFTLPYILAVGFMNPTTSARLSATAEECRLLAFLKQQIRVENIFQDDQYFVALNVEVKLLKKSDSSPGPSFKRSAPNDPDAVPLYLSDDQVFETFSLDHAHLVAELKSRYSDFKCNAEFHRRKIDLESHDELFHARYSNKDRAGVPKKLYSRNILQEFDRFYTRN